MSTVLVVGASRGIGREFVRQYVADGDVIATYRRTEDSGELAALGATPVRLDVIEDDVAGVMLARWAIVRSTSRSSAPACMVRASAPVVVKDVRRG